MAYNFDDETLKYYTQKLKEKLAEKDEIPTKTSDLTNDNGFITIDEVPKTDLTDYQTKSDATLTTTNKTVVGAINELEADSHTHTNEDILDAITSEKITSWNNKAEVSNIPTKTSDLTNDSGFLTSIPSEYITETELDNKGYLTEHQDISGKADKSEIPIKTSQLTNDSNFISEIPSEYITETELNAKGYATENFVTETINNSEYVHPDTHPASMIIFTDGENFQDKLDAGTLKGDKGDRGEQGLPGADGLTTQVKVNGVTYNQVNGLITLPDYPVDVSSSSHTHSNKELLDTIIADNIHTHINKDVIDAITSDMTTKWNKSIPFEDSYVSDCNAWLTNGYTKTSTSTTNHPSVCTGADRWGVLFYISENATNGTGTQMYFPIDGTYAGRVFTRKILSRNAGAWNLLSTFDGNYDNLTNKPTIPTVPTNVSQLTNDAGYITSIPSEYITETELNAKGYLTSVPSEYITEEELESKGYLTEHQDISGKTDKLYVDTELAKKSDKTHTHSYNDLSDKPAIPSIDGLATKKELTDGLATKSDTTHTHDQYLTEHQDLSNYALKTELPSVPTKTSQLTNDSGFITSIPNEYITETELNEKGYLTEHQDISGKANISDLSTVATSGSYNDLIDKPTIPSKTSQLTNDSGYLTSIPNEYITETELNTKGYLTSVPSEYITETELSAKGYLTQHQDISGKVDKINGKGLSTNDYTTTEKNKLNGIEENANNYSLPIASSTVLGGIKVGSGLNIDSNGVLSSSGGSSSDLSNYQTKTDNALTTTDKTIVGAINELDIESVKAEDFEDSSVIIENNLTSRVSNLELTKADISYVDTQIANAQLGGSGGSTNIDLSNYATKDEIPTKTSQLTNDSNFATESYVTDAINNASLGGGEGSSVDLSLYQTKTDNTLTTTNKTIVGAINELDIEGIKAEDYDNDPVVVGNNLVARVSALETNESEVLSRVNSLESNKADVSTVSALEASKADVSRVSALETNKADKSSIPTSLPANGGNSNTVGGFSIWVGTQSEYDSISTKSSTTLYFIREV